MIDEIANRMDLFFNEWGVFGGYLLCYLTYYLLTIDD